MRSIANRIRTVATLLAVCAIAPSFATPATPDASGIDKSVKPGDDFYTYANGPWLKSTAIPPGVAKYDTTTGLRTENARRVQALIEEGERAPTGNLARKIGDYYASQRDAAAIEAKGLTPLSGELADIAAIGDRDALSSYLGRTLALDDGTDTQPDAIFGVWIHQGFHDADHNVPHLVQGGLGLDRDDYLDPSPEKAAARETYRAHIATILKAAGLADADNRAARVLALEIAIAKTHASAEDTADVPKTDNAWRRADFDTKAPGMNWSAYFNTAGLGGQGDFVVWQPSAVTGTAALVASEPLDAWKDYLTFHRIAHYAAALPNAFGADRPADNTQQAIAATTAALGDGIGRLYVERYFPPQNKAAATAMVENIRTAYRIRIANLTWMSPDTKQKALAKLAALNVGLGYPDAWIDYTDLVVTPGDAFGNQRRAEAFARQRALAQLTQPVDPAAWTTSVYPHQAGAIIYFTPNTMQFAAGILQPPYFDASGDAATNYGSAGAGLAHEISHSFDELGNIYDAHGNLGNWWTADDLANYRVATAKLAAQVSAYCPKPGLCLNGKLVSSEATADLTGLLIAHDAYVLSLKGRRDIVINGLTGEQRFFIAFANRWRRVQTDAALKQQVAADTHPPGEYRTDTVRNVDAWYRAFNVKPGDKLYLAPKDRIRIW